MSEWQWMIPPLLAGLMVVITHVRFGQEVLKRGIVFIDLTIAQIAALGVIVATVLGWQAGWLVGSAICSVGSITRFSAIAVDRTIVARTPRGLNRLPLRFCCIGNYSITQ